MNKVAQRFTTLTLNVRRAYTPVSNYEIQKKPNPVIAVNFTANNRPSFDLHFRVSSVTFSYSKTQFQRLLKTSNAFFWAQAAFRGDHFP